MKTKKGDVVELEYTGTIKKSNIIFDTTDESVAKKNNLHRDNINYKPVIVCIGRKELVPGLDDFLAGKETNKEYEVELKPNEAFGEENAKLYRLVNAGKFLKQGIRPYPGLQLDLDNAFCTVKAVSGGRVMIDFNHPLAGKDIIYRVKVNRILESANEKAKAYIEKLLGKDAKYTFLDGKLEITAKLNKDMQEMLDKELKEIIPEIKEIEFKIA